MKKDQDYLGDIAEIRSMMERSSKFLSLSGWAGVIAGLFGLVGAYIAFAFLKFKPGGEISETLTSQLIILGLVLVILAVGAAIFLSYRRAVTREEKIWNKTSKQLMIQMSMPLVSGGLLTLMCLQKGYLDLLIPLTLIFYGIAMFNAGSITFREIKFMGLVQVLLGLLSFYFVDYGLLFWALGFGLTNMAYGIYIYLKYER